MLCPVMMANGARRWREAHINPHVDDNGRELRTDYESCGEKEYAGPDSGCVFGALEVGRQVKYDERNNDSVDKGDGVAVKGELMRTRHG
jgi:hypothetical protein